MHLCLLTLGLGVVGYETLAVRVTLHATILFAHFPTAPVHSPVPDLRISLDVLAHWFGKLMR
jgi:hypothetical protein